MGEVNIMERVRQFLRTYPPLSNGKLNVDFLPEDAKSYSVEAVPAQENIRSYVDGSSVRQCLFVVASREIFGEEVQQQLENLDFYWKLSDWLKEKTRKKELPDLGEGKQA
ncbi:MAG: chloramphenicol resistance protein, partial [Anaerotignum sp.]|nr:chloramphenicol resistance protein [Anaerotignum sp.]